MECPRRTESVLAMINAPGFEGPDEYDPSDNTCSYCGSLEPTAFMARLEAGNVTLTPTDKNYKVYIRNDGGEVFKQTYRDCPRGEPDHGPKECSHWITRDTTETKFYFQHLSAEQRHRFIELLNTNKIKLNVPGYFYVLPFFCQRVSSPVADTSQH